MAHIKSVLLSWILSPAYRPKECASASVILKGILYLFGDKPMQEKSFDCVTSSPARLSETMAVHTFALSALGLAALSA